MKKPGWLKIFRKAPFQPLLDHMKKSMEVVSLLKPLFESLMEGKKEEVEKTIEEIYKKEHECDILKNEIRDHLPRSLFMPVSREDFLRYLHEQDGLPDRVEDIAILVSLKDLKFPEELKEEFNILLDKAVESARLACKITEKLDELMETSFGDKEVEEVHKMIDELSVLEWKTDKKAYLAAKKLFSLEDKLKPSDLILWFNIIHEIAGIADHADCLGKALRLMIAK
jgi:hypothetical protein